MSGELYHLTIAEASGMIARKELSPVVLTEAFLARIEAVDPIVNAYITVTGERALDDARRAESEIAAGNYKGPLHGIPVALKDIYDTAGIRTTCHSHLHVDRVPANDGRAVALLRDAGTVLLGKLATHEFSFGGPSWDLPFPPARNPWNPERYAGGSSSGSGVATAAGMAMATLGSDAAGSIRQPAFFCGITGLKPTFGRVSRQGVAPLTFSLDHVGPMTWTARDAALMLQVLAGYDKNDAGSVDRPVPDYASALSGDIEGIRVGLIRHFYDGDEQADPEMKSAMDDSVSVLEGLGAKVEEVRLSSLHDYSSCGMAIMLCEALAIHERDLRATPEKFGNVVRDRLTLASLLTAADYLQALRLRRQLVEETGEALGRYDVLLTAGGYGPAPKIEQVSKFYLLERPLITMPFDVTGSPTIAVRNGVSTSGLPLGMQIVGRPFDEATVLRVADAYERATAWGERRPPL
ncbi:amidase [Rhizobiales bacterium]|uniref:amidase n=1 Tax=Hongsoonwoonella zoysiae TaxID=2821844 RepID=UPI00155FA3AE|nr:amidase [Hongsoonwoonella zoysiae]NRG16212.1 amidase [Hongsoonwoonella zoysiae]